ncbi:hypothetical protein ACQ86B_00695 [Mycolicibacterium aichiense]|uniref:hypothetical protein n=1 Tax=Mycolicibacterium aichiense TaxID=1799 RepID=UPI003D67F357
MNACTGFSVGVEAAAEPGASGVARLVRMLRFVAAVRAGAVLAVLAATGARRLEATPCFDGAALLEPDVPPPDGAFPVSAAATAAPLTIAAPRPTAISAANSHA